MKPKSLLLALLILSFIENIHAQAPAWAWAISAGGNNSDQANAIATDASGNVYMTGIITSDSALFGSINLPGGMFLVKYNSSGNVVWAKNVGNGFPTSLALDSAGNIYTFSGIGAVDSIVYISGIDTTALPSTDDIALAKFDNAGNLLWTNGYGSSNDLNYDYPNAVATDGSGNILITGYFLGDSMQIGTTTLYNQNAGSYSRLFVAKLNSSGNVLWVKDANPTFTGLVGDFDQVLGITSDTTGNVYITGIFDDSTVTFGSRVLSSGGSDNFFFVKYDGNGNEQWAKTSISHSGIIWGTSIAYDHHGRLLITGFFTQDSIRIGSTVLKNTYIGDSAQAENTFIVKYDTSGSVLWARNAGGILSNPDTAYSIQPWCVISDDSGNAYVEGIFDSPNLAFDTTTLTNSNSANYDFFIAEYDTSGNALWAKDVASADLAYWLITGIGVDVPYFTQGLASDHSGNIYMGGYFGQLPVTFGTTTLNSAGDDDIFLAKLSSVIASVAAIPATGEGISIFPNPATNQVTIRTASINADETVTVLIMNVLGEEALPPIALQRSREDTIIDITNLPAGMYFLQMRSESGFATKKFVKQ